MVSPDDDPIRAARAELDQTGVVPASSATPLGEVAGDVIDRYTLVEEIGEGGMGSVWRAEQEEPVKRSVALKIIKLGMDTREVVVRFEAERQALALMDHPHIAKVLDGGATESGRPYFVMEIVPGAPITDYCDQHKLGLRDRLELFRQVCDAIQHAHQKGVIHRDVKPSNVLVATVGGKPVPKVIDFGIAKATSAELTQKTLFTQHAAMIGTPEYMAPEQAELSGLDIDTRADVYALGALLYEMLTGTKLFDIQNVLVAGYHELVRTIREVEPERPSTRISTLGENASPIALNRHVNAGSLSKRLAGDLDCIVMKALEKDRSRRYETASGLADDILRYLSDEPVVAAPPSAAYRFRKFVRRRKRTVAAGATIAVLVIAGTVGTGIGWWNTQEANAALSDALGEKERALDREKEQRELAQKNATRAKEAEDEARQEAQRAGLAERDATARAAELERVAQFQNEQLGRVDPARMGFRMRQALLDNARPEQRRTLEEALGGQNFTSLALRALEENLFEHTIEAIDTTFADQPLVLAQLMQTMASTLHDLGLLDLATGPQERAVGIRRSELGDEDEVTLSSLVADGKLLQSQGKNAAAEERYRATLAACRRVLGDEHPTTLRAIGGLGIALQALGRDSEAEPLYQEVLATRRRVLGDDHPDTLEAISNMGYLLWYGGRFAEAKPLHEEALAGRRRVLGDEHTDTLLSLGSVGTTLQGLGRFAEAEALIRETVTIRRRVLGDEHFETLATISNLAEAVSNQGRYEEAEPLAREAMEGRRQQLGDDHRATQNSIANYGALMSDLGRPVEAEEWGRLALASRRRVLGDEHLETLNSINNLAVALHEQGKWDEAERYSLEALDLARVVLGDANPYTQIPIAYLQQLYQFQIAAAQAEGDGRALGLALAKQAGLGLSLGMAAPAEPMLAEAESLLFAELPEDDPRLWIAVSAHAGAQAVQGRLDEAEPALRESAEWILDLVDPAEVGFVRRRAARAVVQRVVDLYLAFEELQPGEGHADEAAEWRERLLAWWSEEG